MVLTLQVFNKYIPRELVCSNDFITLLCFPLLDSRSKVPVYPKFLEYKVIWPNRGGGFGISEIVDIVTLDSEEARLYHEPEVLDSSIFFPMNWTFHLRKGETCIFRR